MTDYAPNRRETPVTQPADAAALARLMRAAMTRPLPPPPCWDHVALTGLGIIIGLAASMTLLAIAWIDLRPRLQAAPFQARVANKTLLVPAVWLGPQGAETPAQEAGSVRLRFAWPGLGPASADSADLVHVTIQPADKEHSAEKQMAIWSRFLTPTVWSHPGGLVIRGFKTGSPFERDELYMTAPDGRAFAALCPLTVSAGREEPCRATLRHGPFDLAIRLPRDALSQWERIYSVMQARIDEVARP